MISMAEPNEKEFDWIDDAFDDKKTAEDIANAKGPKLAGILLVVVLIAAVMLILFALIAIPSAMGA